MTQSVLMEERRRTYLPAAGHDWFLPFYDVITILIGADQARKALLGQADLKPGQRVLDIGCGTGSLAVLLKQQHPQVEVIGLDPDPKALARARRKADRSLVSVQLDQGFSDSLPYAAGIFDHVFSSLMFHHLETEQKQRTLREIRRVLRPGGQLHLLDFSAPECSGAGVLPRMFHSHGRLKDNSEDRILALMSSAGLSDAKVVGRRTILFGLGKVAYFKASALEAEGP
ncbi:MAG TPA: class I SAM-dependent methyltransferase [Terriglobales bacterium]|nr:class I SAM-dependent methyltransferase [Terriglobales bacterium]